MFDIISYPSIQAPTTSPCRCEHSWLNMQIVGPCERGSDFGRIFDGLQNFGVILYPPKSFLSPVNRGQSIYFLNIKIGCSGAFCKKKCPKLGIPLIDEHSLSHWAVDILNYSKYLSFKYQILFEIVFKLFTYVYFKFFRKLRVYVATTENKSWPIFDIWNTLYIVESSPSVKNVWRHERTFTATYYIHT